MCRSSRAIILRFNSKTQWQMFLLLYGRHVCVPQKDTNICIWRLHTKLYKFGWQTFAHNTRMKNSRDLILGKVVYISIIYCISDSWLFSLNSYDFYFDHMTGENLASCADILWARHAIFLPHERLLKRRGCLIRPITAHCPIKAANFEPW